MHWITITALSLALFPNLVTAQTPVPLNSEFQLNTYTTDGQSRPAIAAFGQGEFVVAWHSNGSDNDNLSYSIQAQRYESDGSPNGGQFQVNTYSTSTQKYPALGSDGQGGFVIAWMSSGSGGTDTSSGSIQAQRFNSLGIPWGGEIQVNTYTTSTQSRPSIGGNGDGGFVIAWSSFGADDDSSGNSVQAQIFDSSGLPTGSQFQANAYTNDAQSTPSVSASGAGTFVIAWQSIGSYGDDSSTWSIQARRFESDGDPLGGQFQVNTSTVDSQREPAVSSSGSGSFVVFWDSASSSGSDTSSYSIQGQRFNSNGSPIGSEFQVNSYTTGYQSSPAASPNGVGGYVVTWLSDGSSGTDTSSNSIQAQRLAANGQPVGDQFQVNSTTAGSQFLPAVSATHGDEFLVAWSSGTSSGTDSSGLSAQAQRFSVPPLFADGFESGDLSVWSASNP